jgi:hypothetical protein
MAKTILNGKGGGLGRERVGGVSLSAERKKIEIARQGVIMEKILTGALWIPEPASRLFTNSRLPDRPEAR